jgi:hypothetical protein
MWISIQIAYFQVNNHFYADNNFLFTVLEPAHVDRNANERNCKNEHQHQEHQDLRDGPVQGLGF